jgi:hypothetical protein
MIWDETTINKEYFGLILKHFSPFHSICLNLDDSR